MALEAPLRDALAKLRILVIGDLILDHYIWGDATRISPEAPVPVVSVEKDTWVPGGAANVAANLAGLGAQTSLLGAFNDDPDGQRLRQLLHTRNIELLDAGCRPDCTTIVKARIMVQRQQLCRLDREMQPSAYQLPDQWGAVLTQPWDAIVLSDYAKGVVTQPLLDRVRAHQTPPKPLLALDPKPKHTLDLRGMDLMTPNRAEARQLAEMADEPHGPLDDDRLCAEIYQRYAPKYLVITLGPEGMLLCEEGRVLGRKPTVVREVFDVSGAGDTVVAVLTASLAAGASLQDAAELANRAAGIVVGHVGTVPVTMAELAATA